jgi:DNA replication protein DnaC
VNQNGNNCRHNKFEQPNKFNFDLIHGEKDTNRDVYEQTIRKVVLSSLEGISGTVFVYGQTGTGKTYTMMGNSNPK